MPRITATLLRWVRRGMMVRLAGCLLVGMVLPAAAAPVAGGACGAAPTLSSFAALNSSPTLTVAATRFMPDDGTAKLLFHHPQGAGDAGSTADNFMVFQSRVPTPAKFGPNPSLPIIDIVQPPAAAAPDFLTTDSVQLQFQAPPISAPWHRRYFIIVDCEGAKPAAWGIVLARVSDSGVAAWICGILAVFVYVGCMLCLQDQRKPGGTRLFRPFNKQSDQHVRERQRLIDSYPSVFSRQQITAGQLFNPIHLTVNELGVPSVQKFQVILFSSLVVGLLLYLVLRIGNLVSLSDSVVGLIGISGVSAAGAAAVMYQNKRLSFDNWSWLHETGILSTAGWPRPALWSDLFTNNGEFDIYKMQTLVFSVVVAFALFIAGAGGDLATFAVPNALLGVLGLSQVTYIGGMLAQPPSVADLDAALTKLQVARETYFAAVNQGTDTDSDGVLLTVPMAATAVPGLNAKAQLNKRLRTIVPMIESALEVKVNRNSPALQPIP